MEISFAAYLDHLDKLGETLEELTGLAQQKARAAAAGDLESMNEAMRREQALSLTLRGLEQRRDALMKGLGLTGTALSDVPGRAPEELRFRAKKTVEGVRSRYELYRSASDVARTTLECNLHVIEKHMKETPGGDAPRGPLADIRA